MLLYIIYPSSLTAQTFAKGDVNGDGKITSVDAAITLQIAEKRLSSPTAEQLSAADVNGDGTVTSSDAQIILQWAAQGLGTNPPAAYTNPPVLPVLESQSGLIGSGGGKVSLASGVSLSVPAGATTGSSQITLSKNDLSGIDPLNKDCFQISQDVSYYAGSTISIPYSAILDSGEDKSFIDGVGLAFYDPMTRRYEMRVANYTDNGDSLSINLNQIRADSLFASNTDHQLFVHFFRKYTSLSALSRSPTASRIPQYVHIDNVPYLEQGKYEYCWAASTAMAINYYEECHTRENGGEKPWDIANHMDINSNSGIGFNAFYIGAKYGEYVKTRVNAYPERSAWISSDSLRGYLKNRLDAGYPVILYMTSEAHAVLVVGYDDDGRGSIGTLEIHDPQNSGNRTMYYTRSWNDFVSKWGATTFYYTAVIKATPRPLSSRSPVINLLGHREESPSSPGLKFFSPMQKLADINAREIVFNWHDDNTTNHGFIAANLRPGLPRQELPIKSIPSYYFIDMNLHTSNTDTSNDFNAKIDIKIIKETDPNAGIIAYQQEKLQTIPAKSISNTTFVSANSLNIEGQHSLEVKLKKQQDDSLLDTIVISQILFDKGIGLQGTAKNLMGLKVIELKWDSYTGDFDSYAVYRLNTALYKWRAVEGAGILEKTSSDFPFVCNNTPETCYTGEKNIFGLAVKKGDSILITSNVVELPPFYTLTLTTPNVGESWQAGATLTHRIEWSFTGDPGTSYVKIELFKDGSFYKTIAPRVSVGSNGTGYYIWRIPPEIEQGSNYSIKITDTTDTTLSDMSDKSFTIINPPAIKVASPAAGTKFVIGGWVNYEFTCSGSSDMTIKVDLYKAGSSVQNVESGKKVNCGVASKFNFGLPASLQPASDYRIRVTNTADSTVMGESSSFTLELPSEKIKLSPPDIEMGYDATISWTYFTTPPGPSVMIEVYKGDAFFTNVTSNTPIGSNAHGSYHWAIDWKNVKDFASGCNYKMKVTSTDDQTYTGEKSFCVYGPVTTRAGDF